MNGGLIGMALAAAAEGEPAAAPRTLVLALWRQYVLTPPHLSLLLTVAGLALLVLMLAPERQGAAGARLARPLAPFALGVGAVGALALAIALLLRAGIGPGRGLLALLALLAVATGLSVCARALGARVLPDRGALAQTITGLVALLLPCTSLVGITVLLIAVPVGVGAFLLAREPRG